MWVLCFVLLLNAVHTVDVFPFSYDLLSNRFFSVAYGNVRIYTKCYVICLYYH